MSQQELLRQAREREAREGGSYSSSRFERSVDSTPSRGSRSPESDYGYLGPSRSSGAYSSDSLLRGSPPLSRPSPPPELRHSPPEVSLALVETVATPPPKRVKTPSVGNTDSPASSSKKPKKSRKLEAHSSGSDDVDRSGSDVDEKSKGKRRRSTKLKHTAEFDGLAGSRGDDDYVSEGGTVTSSSSKKSKRRGEIVPTTRSPKSPRTQHRKQRGGTPPPADTIAALSISSLNYSAPAIPSPHKSKSATASAELDDGQLSGEGSPEARPIGHAILNQSSASNPAPSIRHYFNDPTSQIDGSHGEEDDELSDAFKEAEYSSQHLASQMLANSGLAISALSPQGSNAASPHSASIYGNNLDQSTGYTRAGKDVSTQMSAVSPGRNASPDSRLPTLREDGDSLPPPSSRPKAVRVRSTRRQIVMLENEPAPKANSTAPINANKISHLTIDYLFLLIATTQLSQDKPFLDSLILTHDYFIGSSDLLAVIVQLYHNVMPSQLTSSSGGSSMAIKVPSRSGTGETPPSLLLSGVSPLAGTLRGPQSVRTPRSPPDSPKDDLSAYDGTESRDDPKEEGSSPTTSRPVSPIPELSEGSTSTPTSPKAAPRVKTRARSSSDVMARADSIISAAPRESTGSPHTSEDMDVALKRLRVINVLKKLIEMRFYTLRSNRPFVSLLQRFVLELFSSSDESEHRYGEVLRTAMKTNAAFVREDAEASAAATPAPVLQDKSQAITSIRYKSSSARKSLDDYSAVEVARQITLIDFQNWVQVPLSELTHAAFNAKDAATSCPRLTICTARFNELAQWVSSTVVLASKKKHRVAVLSKFIQVMEELRRLQNFHTLMAFYSALNQAPILRLRKTWKNLSSRVALLWTGIARFLDNSQDFKTYREYVKSADPPCIPYVGFILGGLTFTEEFPTFIVEETVEEKPEKRKKRTSRSTSSSGSRRSEVGRSNSVIDAPTTETSIKVSSIPDPSVVVTASPSVSRKQKETDGEQPLLKSPTRASKPPKSPSSRSVRNTPPPTSVSVDAQSSSSGGANGEAAEEALQSSAGADSEPDTDLMPMPRSRRTELDDNSAASSGADFSDVPSSPRWNRRHGTGSFSRNLESSDSTSSTLGPGSARLPLSARSPRASSANKRATYASSRRSSSQSISAAESGLSDTDSDFGNSEDDNTKLRRVLNEPIPHTVEPSKIRHSIAPGSSPTSISALSTATSAGTGTFGVGGSSPPNPALLSSTSASSSHSSRPKKEESERSPTRATLRRKAAAAAAAAAIAPDAEGDPSSIIPHGQQMLNWRKMVMLGKSFADVLRFQRTKYDLVPVKEIEKFVLELRQHSWFLEADELVSMSFEIEADVPESAGTVRDTIAAVKETFSSVVRPSDSPAESKKKDKKDKKDKSKSKPTFADLAHDQILFSEFRKFLIAQYSHENLLFWEAVNKFKQIDLSQSQTKIKAMANEIYGKFISGTLDEGAFTIGFGHDIKDYVMKKMAANDFEPGMFDTALQEVEHSLLKPSFGLFLNETQK